MTQSLTYNDMLGAYAPYPAPIRPYLLRAATHPLLSSLLTKSFMRVFIDILGRAPIADPCRPLWLRVDVVADKLNISTKTVTRAIRFLKNKGWLSHPASHDGRNHHGEFCVREFILSAELRHLLGLPDNAATQNYSAVLPESSDIHQHWDSPPLPCPAKTLITSIEPSPESTESDTPFISETTHAADLKCPPEPLSTLSDSLINEQTPAPQAPVDNTPALPDMPCEEPGHIEMTKDKTTPETKMSHGLYIGVNKIFLKEASFKEEAFQIKSQQPNNETNADLTSESHMETNIGIITNNELNSISETGDIRSSTPATPRQPKLPDDLAEMASKLQLSPWGICALMRLAKQMNQRLQDVWQAKREQILNAQATGGRAYRYIQFLLQSGEDFAWRARQSMTTIKPASGTPSSDALSTATPTPEETNYRLYRNKRFAGHNGVQVSILDDGSATFTSAAQSNVYVRPADMSQIYEAITAGKLWPLEE